MKTFKRILASVMVAVMILTAAPLSGFVGLELPNVFDIFASAETYSGTCGENLTWTFNDETGELVISGTGSMDEWYDQEDGGPWREFNDFIKKITIGDNVANVPTWAFRGCDYVTELTIGKSVRSIGWGAFDFCSLLTEIYYTGDLAGWCSIAMAIDWDMIASPLKYGANFYIDGKLVEGDIVIPDGTEYISSHAFYGCTKITSVTIPDSVKDIADDAFYNCDNLTSVTIGNGVVRIRSGAFGSCEKLTSVTLGSGVESIGADAFTGCSEFMDLYYLGDVYDWCSIVCWDDKGWYSAWYDWADDWGDDHRYDDEEPQTYRNWNVSNLYIDGKLVEGNLTIPEDVFSLRKSAFCGYDKITSITIPRDVWVINDSPFEGCSKLRNIVVDEENVRYSSDEYGVLFNKDKTELLQYPAGNMLMSYAIPDSVVEITDGAFYNCDNLLSLTIGEGVASINHYTFSYCNGLTKFVVDEGNDKYSHDEYGVLFNKNKTEIVRYPIGNVREFYTIPDSVISIGKYAFSNCDSLLSVTIPDSVTIISNWVFYDCEKLASIALGKGVTSIDGYAFYNCNSLTSFDVNKDNEKYSSDEYGVLFNKTQTNLIQYPVGNERKDYAVPNSVASVEERAFYNCDKLISITIGKGVKKIGYCAFEYCDSLSDVYYGGTNEDWEKIIVGSYNSCLTEATIHYSSTPPDVPSTDEVITGKLAFATGEAWSGKENYTYTYSDRFFDYDSSKYHHDLALMSMCLEASACVPDGGWKKDASGKMVRSGDDYSGKYPANAETLLNNIGFETWKPYGYDVKPGDDISLGYDTVACVIASKNISDKDTVVAVAVRGGGYEAEWGGNFNIGKDSVHHEGFDKAKTGVLKYIENFVIENGDTFGENVKFWIVGYSRGAAVANLVAAELNSGLSDETFAQTKALGTTKENIYCYGFETPQNTTDEEANNVDYDNIISIVNPIDPVPKVAPSSKGFDFKRYGVTYYLPAVETVANYNGENGFKSQMSDVHRSIYGEYYKEDFTFSELEITILGDVLTKENKSIGQMTYLNNLIDIVSTEALKNRTNYYYNYQGAVQDLMAMFLGGYNTPNVDLLLEKMIDAVKDYLKILLVSLNSTGLAPVEPLDERLAKVLAENTEISYNDALQLFTQVDELLNMILKHTDYAWTAFANRSMLFYPHYGNVLVGWMAYLDSVPSSTRNKLLNTCLKYRTVKVNCPVDVNVYDSTGILVASIIDDEVIPVEGAYLSTYIDENGQKCIVMPFDEEYRIEVTAREDCAVTCSVTETDGETLQDEKVVNYYDLQVNKDETITCTAENTDVEGEEVRDCLYPITDENGDVVSPDEEMLGDEIETFNVTVQSNIEGIYPIGGGEYNKGEFAQVTAVSVHGYVFDGWYCGDTLVTKENEYRFCVLEDVDLKAVYSEILAEPEIKGKVHSVSINDISMSYKDSATVTPSINADSGVNYTVTYSSSNTDVVSVDSNGRLTTNDKGSATITVTVTDEYGNTVSDTCNVEVKYNWWQWIIVIVLFGWIWY